MGPVLHKHASAIAGAAAVLPCAHSSRVCWAALPSPAQVPELWKRAGYPSLRPLGSYLSDLYKRLDMLSAWAAAGKPPSVFWLPGFFFVQSFLTAGACGCSRVSTDGLHGYTCMLTSSDPTRIVKQGVQGASHVTAA
jgi:hypothetical protein